MDITQIVNIIGKLLAAVFVALVAYLVPKVKAWLEAKAGKADTDSILELIRTFVQAADQLFHDTDPTGAIRMQFVKDQLETAGVQVTDSIVNMIEGAVWAVNTATRQAQVQDKAMTTKEEDTDHE